MSDRVNANSFSNDSLAQAELEFTRENIEKCPNIRLTNRDEETGADLFCYVNCHNESSKNEKECRGVVFHGDTVVFKGFSYTPEYTHAQVEEIEREIENFSDWVAYDAYEGAVLRMFYFSARWYISTHRKLDAFRSKWASKNSFGDMFVHALQSEFNENPEFSRLVGSAENILANFQNTLDKEKQYMFLICNTTENRIVCQAPERPRAYHVGTFSHGELDMNVSCGLPYPSVRKFDSVRHMCDEIATKVDPYYMQGLCLFGPNNRQIKVVHAEYQRLFNVRGNVPSIRFRYLELRMNREQLRELYNLYPEYKSSFEEYENILFEIGKNIYNSYVSRFIKKETVRVPREEFQVMSECHTWHVADRGANRVNLDKVMNVLNEQSATNLNKMIQHSNNSLKRTQRPVFLELAQNN